jgi:hypothetical protein
MANRDRTGPDGQGCMSGGRSGNGRRGSRANSSNTGRGYARGFGHGRGSRFLLKRKRALNSELEQVKRELNEKEW